MKVEAHLYRASSPLIPDRTVTALCGQNVDHAREVYLQNLEYLEVVISIPGVCGACMKALKPDARRTLLYGVVDHAKALTRKTKLVVQA